METTAKDAVNQWLGNPEQEGDPINLGYDASAVRIHACCRGAA